MNFPLSGRGGFVAVKVIRQHMFFFALSYNLYDNLFGENMIVLAHQNRDRMAIWCASHTFKQWFTPLKVCYCC